MRPRYYFLSLVTTVLLVPTLELAPLPILQSYSIAMAQTAVPEGCEAEADRLFEQGSQQFNHSQYREAVQTWRQALYLYIHFEQDAAQEILVTYEAIGHAFDAQKQYPEAISAYQQALIFWRKYRDRLPENKFLEEESNVLQNIGLSYSNNGEHSEAISYLQQALQRAEKLNDSEKRLTLLKLLEANYISLSEFSKALEVSQQALILVQTKFKEKPTVEMEALNLVGRAYERLGHYVTALDYYQQSLTIAKKLNLVDDEFVALNNIAVIYNERGQYLQALEYQEQSLSLVQDMIRSLQAEGIAAVKKVCSYLSSTDGANTYRMCLEGKQSWLTDTLNNLGSTYSDLGQYSKALEKYQQALEITRQYQNLDKQATILSNTGEIYVHTGQYKKAIEYYQQALEIALKTGDRNQQASTLNDLGFVSDHQGQYAKALDFYQQALTLAQEIDVPDLRAIILSNMGEVYGEQGDSAKELANYQQAMRIRQKIGVSIITDLNNIGGVYSNQGRFPEALDQYEQALEIAHQTGDRSAEATILSNIAFVYLSQADYARALALQQQSLKLQQEIGNRSGEIEGLSGLAILNRDIGQYEQALALYQQMLALSREIEEPLSEASAIGGFAVVYRLQKQYPQALEYYQQALDKVRKIGYISGESQILRAMGSIYEREGQPDKAIQLLQQALKIQQDVGTRPDEGLTLNELGLAYASQNKIREALTILQQALAIHREINAPAAEAEALSDIGNLLANHNQPELAIVFYKQSVNSTEAIRQNLRGLTREQQESYAGTIADTYRRLANLLLAQGRILEAQQVLELLKLQELRDFTGARARVTSKRIELTPVEQEIITKHNSLIAFGQQVNQCQDTKCSQLSALLDQRDQLTQQFNQTLQTFEAQIRARLSQDRAALDTQDFSRSAHEIVEAQSGTVMVYALVLNDKLWLLWATSGGVVNSVEVPVPRQKLGETVLQFRQLLSTPHSDITQVQATAKQLYDWLIAPIAPELQQNHIKHLVFSLDRVTRYIPMAALFDGQHYLVENYTVSTVLSSDLTRVGDHLPPTDQTSVLALGLSNAVPPDFPALPNVPAELNAIVRSADDPQGIYTGEKFLNQQFDDHTLRDNVLGHQIVHIATHGVFVPGRQDQSYLVLGNGNHMSISSIQELRDLGGVRLVVLSACQTALGEPDQDGIEIASIAYYFLNGGANTVIASLWAVNDASTQQLVQHFYRNLAQSSVQARITRAEALQRAQLSLLQRETNSTGDTGRSIVQVRPERATYSHPTTPGFSHPYYWAPFILIGNGL